MKNFIVATFWWVVLVWPVWMVAQVQVSFPVSRAVFQRSGANTATLRIAGAYSAPLTRIEAKVTALNGGSSTGYQTVQSNPTGGTFSAELPNVVGGWYRLEVRGMNNDQQVGYVAVEPVGIGEVFMIAGQSNAQGVRKDVPGSVDDRVTCINFFGGDGNTGDPPFPVFSRLTPDADVAPRGNGSWCWGLLGDRLVQRLGVPVAFFNAGWGATSVRNWRQSADGQVTNNVYSQIPYPTAMPYANLQNAVRAYANMLGVRAVLWHQGEADNYLDTPANQYADDLRYLINRTRQDCGKTMAWVVARVSYDKDIPGRTVNPKIIAGQNQVINPSVGIYDGPVTDGITERVDNAHFDNAGLVKVADAWNASLSDAFFAGSQPQLPASLANLSVGCPGNNAVSYTTTGPYANVVWETLNDQNQVVGSESGSTITKTGSVRSYRAKAKDGFGNTTYSGVVRVNDAPAVLVTGPTTFCEGGSVALTTAAEQNSNWINQQTGATVATGRLLAASTSGTFFVRLRDISNCDFTSAPVVVQANPLPGIPAVLNDKPTTFCQGDNTVLRATSDGVRYRWSTGADSQTIDVRQPGSYSLTVTDQNGCISKPSNTVTVVVNDRPKTPVIAVSGSTTFCADRSVTLTAPEDVGYIWTNGQVGRSITINQSGPISLRVQNVFGCVSDEANPVQVLVNPLPISPQVTATSRTTFCEGDQTTLIASNPAGQVVWSSGESAQTLTVRQSGTFSARVLDQNGCLSVLSNPIIVEAKPLPRSPSIFQVGTYTLEATGSLNGEAYRWQLGTDSLLTTIATLKVGQSGTYVVRSYVTYSPVLTCLSVPSVPFQYVVDESFKGLSVYPNPSPDKRVTVEAIDFLRDVTITVYSLQGQQLLTLKLPELNDRYRLDLSSLIGGQYLMQVQASGFTQSKRIFLGY